MVCELNRHHEGIDHFEDRFSEPPQLVRLLLDLLLISVLAAARQLLLKAGWKLQNSKLISVVFSLAQSLLVLLVNILGDKVHHSEVQVVIHHNLL